MAVHTFNSQFEHLTFKIVRDALKRIDNILILGHGISLLQYIINS